MGLDDYKAGVTLPDGNMLCFNKRTRQIEILTISSQPADLASVSKDAIMRLKDKLDTETVA